MDNLVDMLIAHEGIELKPYSCPAGRLTIGVGRNIQDLGITREEAIYLLRNDLARVESELYGRFTWFAFLSSNRKNALIDMCFNLGITRFLTFKRMIEAFKAKNWVLFAIVLQEIGLEVHEVPTISIRSETND